MLSDYDLRLIKYEQRYERPERLRRTGIPKRHWNKTWDDYDDHDATRTLRKLSMEYADSFIAAEPRIERGLLVQGPPGVGKTLALCILGVQLSDAGFYVRFMPLADYLDRLIRQIKLEKAWGGPYEDPDAYEEWKAWDEELRRLREVAHLVIFDDIGKEHHTSSRYAVDTLDSFLRRRWNIERPVAMTTNVELPEWPEKYGASMHSFVHEACDIISIRHDADARLRTKRR